MISLCAMEPRYLGPLFLVRDSGDLLIIKTHRLPYRRSGRPLGIGVSDSRHGVVVVWLECS